MKQTTLVLTAFLALSALGCSNGQSSVSTEKEVITKMPNQLVVGGVYSTESGDGDFGVVKILALDDPAIHIRIYKNKYPARPASIDLKSLSLGSIDDPDGFGMGHLPLSREGFSKWNPVFVVKGEVSEEELEGYEMWKESGGGIWP